MYGYPEQFIPAPELVGYGAAPQFGGAPGVSAAQATEVTA
jgi:Amt family ammonium transporter